MKVDEVYKSFTSILEYQQYITAQFKTITTLTREKTDLVEKIKHLEKLLQDTNPLISVEVSHEEFICVNEIQKLKTQSETEPLTYEETKKLDTYVKILNDIKEKKKKKPGVVENLDVSSLIDVVEN